ncbi:MAG: hypothetical protein RQ745_10395 [Longimicrobiales bacterium]|nr:hypothetical protein [Longimicrobiales bacterium]
MRERPPARVVRLAAHLSGVVGAGVCLLFAAGLTIPTSDEFPDSLWVSFHTFFVGAVVGDDDALPEEHDPEWMERARPGDVLFMSRGKTPWGRWTHVAMVVRAPDDATWVEPGSIAVLDSGIFGGIYLQPLSAFREWPRVVIRRATDDPEVARRLSDAAVEQRDGVFAAVTLGRAPYSNCTKVAIDALRSEGFDPEISGWWVPDELFRSEVWQ